MKPLICASCLLTLLASCSAPAPQKPPQVAGQPVPDRNVVLDFTKRYNLEYREGDETRKIQNCRIQGYTGEAVRDATGALSKSYYGDFGRWLVLELADGRLACLPGSRVSYLEESRR
ncbi:MAG TPA: hypothetical protein DIT13_00075 [Verrucomicrobiales bacterium]|nr:hypothetical protein [Verrucomicrobiales bacterium]HRJ11185.1 hypothetical protein [Prosthecobacter sp.]HRK16899.1 hypothetical protein [Prosthecobacter sp.]